MKVLILGGNGMLGPWAVRAMKDRHDILLTDINDPYPEYKGEYQKLSADDVDGVVKAAEGMDVIVNLSVLRPHRKIAFDVNMMGNYAMMVAARENRIKHMITSS
ncbi:MAG: NAD(P)-dependent oxidoreductase, partial [Chloroflexi bacterium]|nr:NAD(P)-dependent oxidoreductase [Chloroflexota bacterium]